MADYLTDVYYDYLINKYTRFKNLSYTQLKQNILLVNVYYDDLSYTVIEESPKSTIIDLVSSNVQVFLKLSINI